MRDRGDDPAEHDADKRHDQRRAQRNLPQDRQKKAGSRQREDAGHQHLGDERHAGRQQGTARMPRLADSAVPAVDGSTKRLGQHLQDRAGHRHRRAGEDKRRVRGMRLTSRTCRLVGIVRSSGEPSDTSLTPTNRLISASRPTTAAGRARHLTSGRNTASHIAKAYGIRSRQCRLDAVDVPLRGLQPAADQIPVHRIEMTA